MENNMDVLDAMLNYDKSVDDAVKRGKADPYCKAQGSFVVAELSNGSVDYFPYGQPPNYDGSKDLGAVILERWTYRSHRWSVRVEGA